MLDFTEPRAMLPCATPAPPKTSSRHCSSAASPTRVEVPCPSMRVALAGDRSAICQARRSAIRCPIGLGAVMPLPRPSLEPASARSTA